MAKRKTPGTGEEWRDIGEGAWRPGRDRGVLRAARAGIREHRTREATLRLVDRAGRPLAGAEVEVELARHAFPFGDQLWPLDALVRDGRGDGERARAWRRRFADVFNAATNLCYWTERPRNDASKTEDRQGEPRVENFAATVAWTRAEGMLAKGHPLFWSIPKCIPEWVKRYDPATLMRFAEVRVRNLVARFRGQVAIWDAVNEPMWEAAPKNLARREWPHLEPIADLVEYVAPVLRWCREEDPDATFLVNDYGMEQEKRALRGNDGSRVTAASQRKRFLALLRALGDAGAAPDAVGLQQHTGGWLAHALQWRVYDEFAASGLPVHVTEFWADADALRRSGRYSEEEIDARVAEYVADYLTCAFGHPAVEGFFFWGFMDRALRWFDGFSSHEPRPVYERVRRLLREEWHTRERGRTGPDGTFRFRGFHGDYAVRVAHGEGRRGRTFRLDRGTPAALPVEIVFPWGGAPAAAARPIRRAAPAARR